MKNLSKMQMKFRLRIGLSRFTVAVVISYLLPGFGECHAEACLVIDDTVFQPFLLARTGWFRYNLSMSC